VSESVRHVRLRDIDVEQFWTLEQHHEAILREFTLIAIASEIGEPQATPQKVLKLVRRTRERFMAQREGVFKQVREATEDGAQTVTVTLDLPVSAASMIQEAADAFELADDYCRAGDLLTLASPPEVSALRRDLCARIVEQLQDADT
jgi:hypothetical protein